MLIFSRKTLHQKGSIKMQLLDGNDLICPQKNCLDAVHDPKKDNGRFLEKQRITISH